MFFIHVITTTGQIMRLLNKSSIFMIKISVVVCVVIILFFIFICFFLDKGSFHCSANMRVESASSGFTADFRNFLIMKEDRLGYFDVSGKAMVNGVKYSVERSYSFNYEKKEDDIYHITKSSISKRAADNIVDNVMHKYFLNFESDSGRYIKIKKLNNAYVIQTLYSPSFICIPG